MSTYQPNFRSAAELTAQARAAAALAATGYELGQFLPSVNNASLTYSFDLNSLGLTDVAEYRAFDATVGYGQGASQSGSVSGTLPPISRRYRVKELEQLTLQVGGTGLIPAKQDEYAQKGGLAIAARVALAQAEAIEFDQVRLLENGLDATIRYRRNPDLFVIAANYWSDTTVDVLEPLLSALQTYYRINGVYPGTTLISQRILDALSRNRSVIAHALGRQTDLPGRVGYADVYSFFTDWNVRNVRVFEGNIDRKNLLSDNKIFFLPAPGGNLDGTGALGTTEWGITAESIQPVYGIGAGEQSGIFAAAFDDNIPQGTDVLSTAVVLPALRNSNAVMTFQVLAAAA